MGYREIQKAEKKAQSLKTYRKKKYDQNRAQKKKTLRKKDEYGIITKGGVIYGY